MRLRVFFGSTKVFPSQQEIGIPQLSAQERKTESCNNFTEWQWGEESLYAALLGTEWGSEEQGRTQPCSPGCMGLGCWDLLLPWHGDHGSNDHDGLPLAPLVALALAHTAWQRMVQMSGIGQHMSHQKGGNSFGKLNKVQAILWACFCCDFCSRTEQSWATSTSDGPRGSHLGLA